MNRALANAHLDGAAMDLEALLNDRGPAIIDRATKTRAPSLDLKVLFQGL